MSEIKRRTKKDPPPAETETPPPRRERVTLTKDVSSRYRKLVPRAKASGSAPSRPSRSQDQKTRTEPGGPSKPPRRSTPGPSRKGPSEAVKALLQRELPEAARQLRETQELLRTTAEDILTILEDWERLPHKEIKATRTLVNVLFEKMSFQDLAGQRLAKVENFVKTLDEIARTASPADRPRPPRTKPPASKGNSLKGPQAAGGGLDQGEIEALMADLQGPAAPGPKGRRYRGK